MSSSRTLTTPGRTPTNVIGCAAGSNPPRPVATVVAARCGRGFRSYASGGAGAFAFANKDERVECVLDARDEVKADAAVESVAEADAAAAEAEAEGNDEDRSDEEEPKNPPPPAPGPLVEAAGGGGGSSAAAAGAS